MRIIKQIQTRKAGNFVAKESAPQKCYRGMKPHDNEKVKKKFNLTIPKNESIHKLRNEIEHKKML